ncbi:Uncharacterized protein PRO82_002180 [Candidatus Protochlamydia amoebophila]|nr:Uncharacterized protein [Candidatus Protochlamydia amoebophila]
MFSLKSTIFIFSKKTKQNSDISALLKKIYTQSKISKKFVIKLKLLFSLKGHWLIDWHPNSQTD